MIGLLIAWYVGARDRVGVAATAQGLSAGRRFVGEATKVTVSERGMPTLSGGLLESPLRARCRGPPRDHMPRLAWGAHPSCPSELSHPSTVSPWARRSNGPAKFRLCVPAEPDLLPRVTPPIIEQGGRVMCSSCFTRRHRSAPARPRLQSRSPTAPRRAHRLTPQFLGPTSTGGEPVRGSRIDAPVQLVMGSPGDSGDEVSPAPPFANLPAEARAGAVAVLARLVLSELTADRNEQ